MEKSFFISCLPKVIVWNMDKQEGKGRAGYRPDLRTDAAGIK
jgi:hypothetical protein